MEEMDCQNTTIHISRTNHMNITFNLCQCGKIEIVPGNRSAVHNSDEFTIFYVYEGSGHLTSNYFSCEVREGKGFFAFPEVQYGIQNKDTEKPLRGIWLTFTGYLVENYLARADISRTKPLFSDPDNTLGDKLKKLYTASLKLPNRYCRMMSLLYSIFSDLLDANIADDTEMHYVDDSNQITSQAVEYIEQNYSTDISVDDISNAVGITRKRLYDVFNRELKISPKQYLIYYRMEHACIRLHSTTLTVLEIAESVGYSNQFYFAKEFKRLTDMTPSEYRKQPQPNKLFSYHSFARRVLTEDFNDSE